MNKNDISLLLLAGITDSHALYEDGVRKRFGGGAMYGGKTAAQLGIQTQVLTIGASDIDAGISELESDGITVYKVPTQQSNNFSNDYRGKRKIQMRSFAEKRIQNSDIPDESTHVSAVILYPTYHEVDPSILKKFPNALKYVDASGYMRNTLPKNSEELYEVIPADWKNISDFFGVVDVVKISDEDVENLHTIGLDSTYDPIEKAKQLSSKGFPIVILTRADKPPLVIQNGEVSFEVPIHPIQVQDPAGAGEVFGVGFVVEYLLSGDLKSATAFGNACASYKIAGENFSFETAQKRKQEILDSVSKSA